MLWTMTTTQWVTGQLVSHLFPLTFLPLQTIYNNNPIVTVCVEYYKWESRITKVSHSVVSGQPEAVEAVLAGGGSITTPDSQGGCPLHYAAQGSNAPLPDDEGLDISIIIIAEETELSA